MASDGAITTETASQSDELPFAEDEEVVALDTGSNQNAAASYERVSAGGEEVPVVVGTPAEAAEAVEAKLAPWLASTKVQVAPVAPETSREVAPRADSSAPKFRPRLLSKPVQERDRRPSQTGRLFDPKP